MLPNFILPETTINDKGSGEPLALEDVAGETLVLTLGITDIVEQQSLDVSILGSEDGENWGEKPVRVFPQKFYRGVYGLLLDLSAHPGVKYLKADWKTERWGVGSSTPMFRFYVFAETLEQSAARKTA
jgi:hypothetical protein